MKISARNIDSPLWVILAVLAFLAINGMLMMHNMYLFLAFPALLLVIYLSIISLDKLLLFTVFLVPISVPLEWYAPKLGFNAQLPTEPILVVIMFVFIYKTLHERTFDIKVLRHPITIAIFIYLFWMFVTTMTSSMPLISVKFLVSKIWFLIAFYFLATQVFRSKKQIITYAWVYIPAMVVVIITAIVYQSSRGVFNQQSANFSPRPFFVDHTSYGALLAMIFPFLVGIVFYRKSAMPVRIISMLLIPVFLFALLLSYSRAAWISIGVAFGVFLVLTFRIKFIYLFMLVLLVGSVLYVNRIQIKLTMEENHQDSSKDLEKHLRSIYNIRSDVSNLERINRWNSAFKMFMARPVFGFGPGTYQFQYAPFQVWRDHTEISTNMGDWGNAHSEYIGPLAEEGVLGAASILLIIITTLYTAIRLYPKTRKKRSSRIILLSALLGLVTYYVHGILNDFLDTDKASALFWGFTAVIVALDVYHLKSTADKVAVRDSLAAENIIQEDSLNAGVVNSQ